MITPNTEVRLLNTPLSAEGEYQLNFATVEDQANYFLGKVRHTFTDFTYQRKEGVIRVNKNIDQLYNVNYVMYRNNLYTGKWFYAYIVSMEWLSDNTTAINIKTDFFQTWLFDFTVNKSYVDRQHYITDNKNTLDDSIGHGQLIQVAANTYDFSGGYFIFMSGMPNFDSNQDFGSHSFNIGNYSIPCWVLYFGKNEAEQMGNCMQLIAAHGRGDRIITALYMPFLPYGEDSLNLTTVTTGDIGTFRICDSFKRGGSDMTDNITFNMDMDYKNLLNLDDFYLKSLTFPYSKLVVTDTASGQNITLSPEKFDSDIISFQRLGTISEVPTIKIVPRNYLGEDYSYSNSLVISCNTNLPVANNQYARYLMMNSEVNNISRLSAATGIVASLAAQNPAGVFGGLQEIRMINAHESQAARLPDQITAFSDDAMERLNFNNSIKISLYMMDRNHILRANNYWKLYGYPVNSLATPNLKSGKFNFIKTVGANISGGNIPQDDMRNLTELFDRGVTLWNDIGSFKNF